MIRSRLLPFALLAAVFIVSSPGLAAPSDAFPGQRWETIANPAEVGWSEAKLQLARDYAKSMNFVGGMVVYNGKILFQFGKVDKRGNLHSVRKSLISALYGIYSTSGEIDLDATIGQLGIDDCKPVLTESEKQAHVIDLLKARSGVYHVAAYETGAMKDARPERGSHAPGSYWYYNNWDFNVLGTIFEKQTGLKIGKAFRVSIAEPVGMEDFREKDVGYVRIPDSIHAAYPFEMTARDMARFGLLYLHEGKWQDRQVIPSQWVLDSTKAYSDAGPGVGYGYLWWVAKGYILGTKIDGPAYRAQGAGGQYIVVLPSRKLVLAYVSDCDRTGVEGGPQFSELLKLVLAAQDGH